MDIINLFTGLLLIGLGFLVKSFPNLISGYNTMPKEKKKNVDIEGLSTYMRNSLITIGSLIIVGYYLFKWMGFTMIANSMIMFVTLIGVTIMVINSKKFDHNKNKAKKTKLTYAILGMVIVFVIGLLSYGYMPSNAFISSESVKFTGMYGFEMNASEIESIEITDQIPAINLRTNGFSFGEVKKGFFDLEEFGKTRLLMNANNAPYLIITTVDGDKVIINSRDKKETEKIFSEIKAMINK